MSFFEDTPVFSTGSKEIDGFCTISLILIVGGTVIGVINCFRQALTQTRGDRHHGKRSKLRNREVQVFLLIALVTFIVVNWLRFEHRRLKIVSWDAIDSWQLSKRLPDA